MHVIVAAGTLFFSVYQLIACAVFDEVHHVGKIARFLLFLPS